MSETNSTPRFINFAIGAIVLFLAIWVLIIGRAIILPFMIAAFLTFVLDPIITLLIKIKIPRGLAVFITMIISFVILYLIGLLVYSNVQTFVQHFPTYEERLVSLLEGTVSSFEQLIGQQITVELWEEINWLEAIKDFSIASNVVSGVGTFFSFFGKMLIVTVFMAYMLMGKNNLKSKVFKAFPDKQAKRIDDIIDAASGKIQKYLGTKLLVSTITGIISFIIFTIFGLDFAIFWSIVIFLFNFIPNIGSIIASLLPVIFSILQFGTFSTALWLLLVLGILQFIMGNVLEPRLMGYSLNLSPMIVILSLIFWGYIWGVAGMLLSVPILATSAIVFERIDSLKFISVFLKGEV
ncbi:MAG: AI-2E family transporter [Calditrichaeota bacterium]|nr:MAG: AI-2E family transporter [Calditrichota bacterium]MBL1203960.1 AI-2E family transporter [Calditrichota bacterium]NOG43791.1 AI-2E family transporter [Calditrichota bacterium]